jgi:hypothetical protein
MSLRLLAFAGLCVLSINARAQFDGNFYHARYGLADTDQKLINNHGEGYEGLYGVRNFREVIKGVMFRGGANNIFHRDHTRPNANPLPDDGLQNLCEEGFKNAVYLYTTNYSSAPPRVSCNSIRGPNELNYRQLSFSSKYKEILQLVHAAILDPAQGPVFVHCWNGWHAAGMLSAMAFRQFCGWSGDKAVAYWVRNTDGTDDGAYESIKRRIRDFQPYPEMLLDAATQARVCPN